MKRKAILITSLLIFFWCTNSVFAQNSKVLFVLSAADTLLLNKGEKKRQTGVFLSEFYLVYKSLITNQLKKLGLKYKSGFPGSNYAVRDRNLVTSQNPYSESAFNELFLQLLSEKNDQITCNT